MTKFHVRADCVKIWSGEDSNEVRFKIMSAAKSPDVLQIQLRYGQNLWAQWERANASDVWSRTVAARGQENISAYQIIL